MHSSLRRALIALPLFAIACGDDQSTAPSTPHVYVASTNTISQQIDALYPITLGHRDAAQAKWRALQDAIAKDKPNQRIRLMHLIDWTLKREKEGVLSDPNGSAPPSTRLAVSILTASLYQAVYPDAPAPPIVEEGVDVGAGVVDPGVTTTIVSEQSQAGGEFEAGTWTQPVLVTFVEQTDPPSGGSGPLPAGNLNQYPKFYQITAFPNDPTKKDIRIGICHVTDEESPYFPPEPHSSLRVAKEKQIGESSELMVLDRVEVADFLNCIDVTAEEPFVIGAADTRSLSGFAMRAIGKAVKGLASMVTPEPLYAVDQGIGGRLPTTEHDAEPTGAFSLFGLIDVSTPTADAAACATPVPGYSTYPSVEQAVAATRPGGTTYICGGTYLVNDLYIRKPITIRSLPEGGTVFIQNSAPASASFVIDDVSSGTVQISGLHFLTSTNSSIVSRQRYDQVWLEGNTYIMGLNAAAGVDVEASSIAGAKVTVIQSAFDGGYWGAFARGNVEMDVLESHFAGQGYSNIQHQYGSRGRVRQNRITRCGFQACIRGLRAAYLEIRDNYIEVSMSNQIQYGIEADTGLITVMGNTIIGYGARPDAETVMSTDSMDYPMISGGIALARLASTVTTGELRSNRIQGAYRGISIGSGNVTGTYNVIDSTMTAFEIRFSSVVAIGGSDVRTYNRPFAISSTATVDLTCNYWGYASGPTNTPSGVSSAVWTPWATDGGAGSCTGGN